MRKLVKYARAWAGFATVLAVLAVGSAAADRRQAGFGDYTEAAPKAMDGIGITERVGAALPLDLAFRDHTGAMRTTKDIFVGDVPTILTFNYTTCPQLCSMQLTGLAHSLATSKLEPGKQFQVVTIIIEPTEPLERAARTRQHYIDLVAKTSPSLAKALDRSWLFLVAETSGDDRAIKAMAASVGFGYKWIADQGEYGHAAAAILITPSGKVSRYLGGIQFPDALLDTSLYAAAAGESSQAAGMFLRCFMYDKHEGAQRAATSVMRWGTFAFVVVFLVGLLSYTLWRNLRGVPTQHEMWSKLP